MIIMFILMFLPLLAMPVFWYLPISQALLIYLVSVLLSFWMFWLMKRNKKRRITTGREALRGREHQVLSISRQGSLHIYTVRTEGELWNARSEEILHPGDTVIVEEYKGNTLFVRKK